MMKRAVIVFIASILLNGTYLFALGIPGSGDIVEKDFSFSNFERIKASGLTSLTIKKGDEYRLSVRVDKNILRFIKAGTKGDDLLLRFRRWFWFKNYTFEAEITLPDLESAVISGGCRAEISGFTGNRPVDIRLSGSSRASVSRIKSPYIGLRLSGSSQAALKDIRAEVMRVSLSGSSEAALNKGKTDGLIVHASGSSDFSALGKESVDSLVLRCTGSSSVDAARIKARDAEIDLSGSSSASLDKADKIDGSLSGSSVLYYQGKNTGKINLSGGSEIRGGRI